ncbi:MAG: DUF45 domain-containing protein [Rhodobacteraceae bacterium]|nr:DUF45 domain-containing protein [Paracoccaceae bacterium]
MIERRFCFVYSLVKTSGADPKGLSHNIPRGYRREVDHAIALRDTVRLHSGDAVDMKQFEPAILHEMAHFVSRRHDDAFVITLDLHMPAWRQIRADLNALSLAEMAP